MQIADEKQEEHLPSPAPASSTFSLSSWLKSGNTIKTEKWGKRIAPLTRQEDQELEESLLKRGFLAFLPIIINSNGDILDGHHRYWKCQKLGIDPLLSIHDEKSEEDYELFVLDCNLPRRHLTRFQKIEYEIEKESILEKQQAERNMKAGVTLSRNQERVHRDERLADKMVCSKDTIHKERNVINSQLFKENEQFRQACRTEVNMSLNSAYKLVRKAEDDKKPNLSPLEWAKCLEGMTDLERFDSFGKDEYQNRSPMQYNAIMLMKPDPRLGDPSYPGNTSGQVVMNFLYYYTKQNDLVVDPMAGGGTTIDTCSIFNRRCLAFDISPKRPDIYLPDMSKGYPDEAYGCDVVWLDPPYGPMMKEYYCKESISSASIADYLKFIEKLAIDSFAALKQGGYVSLVIMPLVDEPEGNEDNFINLPFECIQPFRDAGFKDIDDWEIPLPPHVKNQFQVDKAKRKKLLLNLHRRLIIFKKPSSATTT